MTANFIQETSVISTYGLNGKKTFDQQFSKASIENILFYVFATALWAVEKLFDLHVSEVENEIEQLEPHTLLWYVNKAKAFMYGYKLITDCDYYDTSDMSDTDIEAAKVVKYAVATESNTVVYLKVAGEEDGSPCQLSDNEITALTSYMNSVKDAGVSIKLINDPADQMKISLKVYYDPALLANDGTSLADGDNPVENAIISVLTNLPFNGVFRNSDLLAAVQAVDGVEAVDILSVKTKTSTAEEWSDVSGYACPAAGYYVIVREDNDIEYEEYSLIDNVQN